MQSSPEGAPIVKDHRQQQDDVEGCRKWAIPMIRREPEVALDRCKQRQKQGERHQTLMPGGTSAFMKGPGKEDGKCEIDMGTGQVPVVSSSVCGKRIDDQGPELDEDHRGPG